VCSKVGYDGQVRGRGTWISLQGRDVKRRPNWYGKSSYVAPIRPKSPTRKDILLVRRHDLLKRLTARERA